MPILVLFKVDGRIQGGTVQVIADSLEDSYQYIESNVNLGINGNAAQIERLGSEFYSRYAFFCVLNGPWPKQGWDSVHSYYSEEVLREYLDSLLNDHPEYAQYIDMLRWDESTDKWHEGYIYPRTLTDWFEKDAELGEYIYFVEDQFELSDVETRRGITHITSWSM